MLYGGASAIFERCRLIGNDGDSGFYGGGLGVFYRCATTVNECLFVGNSGIAGGGATVGNAAGTFTNCVFIGNKTTATSGPYLGGGAVLTALGGTSLRFNNSTLIENRSAAGARTIAGFDGVSTQMFNTTVRGSGTPLVGTFTGSRNNIQGGAAGTSPVAGDPAFRRTPATGPDTLWGTGDDDLGDLRLSVGSPLINAGSNLGVPVSTTTDFAGEIRILGSAVDVGAFEFRCPADFNADGNIDPDDLGDFINCYFSTPPCDRADFSGDGNTDPDDLGDFINAYFAGAC